MTDIDAAQSNSILVGGAGPSHVMPQHLLLKQGNRHGLIAGATGTGKTATLQTLAECLSLAGVPAFMADVKGDLASMACAGSIKAKPPIRSSPAGPRRSASRWTTSGLSGDVLRCLWR